MRKKEGASGDSIPASVAFRLYCQDVLAEIKEVPTLAERAETARALRAQASEVHKTCLEADPGARPQMQQALIRLVLATLV